jgi:pyruvate-ferredoxin/flavodoxin oxidoreductase
VSYAFTDVAIIYPITPSSAAADEIDKYSFDGRKNLFGRQVKVVQMQSEAGVAGAMHGCLAAGALATTYTASQGLLLMIPNMYKIAGEFLPNVVHVSARAIATHALSIFGDHSDVYACRQTGYAMICSNNPQEIMHLSAVAHLSSIKGRIPFLHFFDGLRTSHEIQKINVWDYGELSEMIDWDSVNKFRKNALNPENPTIRGTAQNGDVFFQNREAGNKFYDNISNIVLEYMNEVNKRTGRDYKPFNYYGHPEAVKIIIAMGSVCETIEETVDYLNSQNEKVGLVKVRLYRPFVSQFLLNVLPKSVEKISVLDRTKEPGSVGEPLYLDILAGIQEFKGGKIEVYSGRYGLSSKNTTPSQIFAVYNNMESENPKKRFTIGINDDVTNLSLTETRQIDTAPKDITSCKFWGLGSDGTVGANKNTIKIIGDNTAMNVQGYFSYDSKKSGGATISHLRFGESLIKSTYFINKADFVACHNPSYVYKYDMVEDLKPNGKFLLNCPWNDDELSKYLPGKMKKFISDNNIRLYTISGIEIGKELGLGGRINTILQAAFFKIINIMDINEAVDLMKQAATKSYSKKGEKIVKMNHDAIDQGIKNVHEVSVPDSWSNINIANAHEKCLIPYNLPPSNGGEEYASKFVFSKSNGYAENLSGNNFKSDSLLDDYVKNILIPCNNLKGNSLPVSEFLKYSDGTVPSGSAAYEKRGIAIDTPEWIPENCTQCNLCAYVCPHAVIRPGAMTNDEINSAPENIKHKKMIGFPDLNFSITVSTLDCTGCGVCVSVCPGMKGNKALVMRPAVSQLEFQKYFDYCEKLPLKSEVLEKFKQSSIKGSQFKKPLLEFSGACAGCGETPYAKLATQLFGDRMYIANATGCSSIWGASFPSTPYTKNYAEKGPAWQNSLFEDNAEFGYGISIAQNTIRQNLFDYINRIYKETDNLKLKETSKNYIDTFENGELNQTASSKLLEALKSTDFSEFSDLCKLKNIIIDNKNYLSKKSVWIFGGDGWAYDIGFGGLDHVIASGENVNILVFDTEAYSNTGGQSSKATPLGSVVQFAAKGKSTAKKDLATMAMTYGHVYVAQVAMGADYNQCLKTFIEAENYNGPSIIIAYSPCINHGIKDGMCFMIREQKKAVEAGYWNLFRFNPELQKQNKNPFVLDSKAPAEKYKDFITNEIRYDSLNQICKNRADTLFEEAEKFSKIKYEKLANLAKK